MGGNDFQQRGEWFFEKIYTPGFMNTVPYAGELLVVPSGVMETDTEAKVTHCTYVFTRIDLNR